MRRHPEAGDDRSAPAGRLRKFEVRAEFRRLDRDSSWVLAGVWIADRFHPVAPGVEPIRRRLPAAGLVGWVALDPVLARSADHAASIAFDLAAGRWPKSRGRSVPHP